MSFFKKTSSSPPPRVSNTKVSSDKDDDDDDLEVRNAADDITGHFKICSGRKGKCEMCTESLGFESTTEKMDGSDELTMESLTASSSSPLRSTPRISRVRICGVVREKTNLKEFPPLLSMLDESGRPRFDFNKVRRNGGLKIDMVRNDKPGVVRILGGRDGEVRMEMVKRECDHQEEQEDSEVSEEEERESM